MEIIRIDDGRNERSILLSEYSDTYKEVYGFRPRGDRIFDASEADIQLALDSLYNRLGEIQDEERAEAEYREQRDEEDVRMDRMRLSDEEESRMHANEIRNAAYPGGSNFSF